MTEKLSTRKPGPIAKKIWARESFRTNGALKGVARPEWIDFGMMCLEDFYTLHDDKRAYGIDYVIYSYTTPIAWLRGDGSWTMPEAGYSVTTKRHKATILAALQRQRDGE